MPLYTIVAPMTHGGHTAHVHRAGCADLAGRDYRHEQKVAAAEATAVQAALAFLNADDLGYQAADVRVFPCCQDGAALDAQGTARRQTEDALKRVGYRLTEEAAALVADYVLAVRELLTYGRTTPEFARVIEWLVSLEDRANAAGLPAARWESVTEAVLTALELPNVQP